MFRYAKFCARADVITRHRCRGAAKGWVVVTQGRPLLPWTGGNLEATTRSVEPTIVLQQLRMSRTTWQRIDVLT